MQLQRSEKKTEIVYESTRITIPAREEPIPAILMLANQTRPSGRLVFFLYGMGGAKENAVPPGLAHDPISANLTAPLLRAGYDVVAIDNPGHGERLSGDSTHVEALTESIAGRGVDLIERGRVEAKDLVDWALETGLVSSPSAIGVAGQSWGGFQAIGKMIGEPRLAAAVAVIPVVTPEQLEPFARFVDSPRLTVNDITGELAEALGGRPLLIVSGRQDTVSPVALTRIAVERWRRRYCAEGADESLQHVVLDGVAHGFDERESALMIDWFDRHLVAAAAQSTNAAAAS